MNIFKKALIYLKYERKKLGSVGHNVDYKQLNSHFLHPQNIEVGSYSKILDGAFLDAVGGIIIGECTIIGPNITILTSNHIYEESQVDFLPYGNMLIKKTVSIGNYCWLGRGVTILPGVTIGKGCVVGAKSVVTRDVEDYSVVGGNPAALLRKRDGNLIEKMIRAGRCVTNVKINTNPTKKYVE